MPSSGNIFRMEANQKALMFLREWLEYCSDLRVITDDPNTCGLPNLDGFRSHRHDQSILTNLTLKHEIPCYGDPLECLPRNIQKDINLLVARIGGNRRLTAKIPMKEKTRHYWRHPKALAAEIIRSTMSRRGQFRNRLAILGGTRSHGARSREGAARAGHSPRHSRLLLGIARSVVQAARKSLYLGHPGRGALQERPPLGVQERIPEGLRDGALEPSSLNGEFPRNTPGDEG